MAAKKLGMHNGEYMFIAIDLEIASSWDRQKFTRGFRPVKNVLSGIISVKVSKVDMKQSKYKSFNDEVIRRMAQQPFNINVTSSVCVTINRIFLIPSLREILIRKCGYFLTPSQVFLP